MVALLHIISKQEAETAKISGVYKPDSLNCEGFIHCSYPNQVCRVANYLFKGNADLVLLEIDKTQLTCEVIDEDLYEICQSLAKKRSPEIFQAVKKAIAKLNHKTKLID